jgi:hypothetical protein
VGHVVALWHKRPEQSRLDANAKRINGKLQGSEFYGPQIVAKCLPKPESAFGVTDEQHAFAPL